MFYTSISCALHLTSLHITKITMDQVCFFCVEPLVPGERNILKTSCCHRRVHLECEERWSLGYFHCGYCRTSLPILEPIPAKFLNRFRMTKSLLSGELISSLTVTITDSGSDVDDDSLISTVRKDLGSWYSIFIERDGRSPKGFHSGRVSQVKIETDDGQYFIVDNRADTI